jgi:hypothetical protein
MKRGDALRLILIQVKGGKAAKPTIEDVGRLRGSMASCPQVPLGNMDKRKTSDPLLASAKAYWPSSGLEEALERRKRLNPIFW